ncbi:hypothetical protein CYMTET_23250 [Cymbomonas tetramitiformis]|uniref:Ankyrin repeat domain-containing protein n=1 Tax=Cymbomonas tetramitiformis TaxID=36881 RepID=A0AAE0L1E3_9CHLO|nr:hypothetical protein CYMTET_23250 [Cymbomonas tetramitiformis]
MTSYVSGYDGHSDLENEQDYDASPTASFWKHASEEELNARKAVLEADPGLAADERAISPLIVAARANFARLALRALSVGYTTDERADDGRDAIRIAADHGYGRLVDILIEQHSSAQIPMSAVDIATMRNDALMVCRLKKPTIDEGSSIRNFYQTHARKLSAANRK